MYILCEIIKTKYLHTITQSSDLKILNYFNNFLSQKKIQLIRIALIHNAHTIQPANKVLKIIQKIYKMFFEN